MVDALRDVRFVRADDRLQREGLLGWASATIRGLRIDGLVVRVTALGRTAVFFPERADKTGKLHRIVWIPDADERDSLARTLLAVLRARGDLR